MQQKFFISVFVLFCCFHSFLLAQQESLREVVVSTKIDPEKVVKNIANNFSNKYRGNYAAKVTHYRLISCGGKPLEFNALQGVAYIGDFKYKTKKFYWDNRSSYSYIVPETVMRTNPYNYDGSELEVMSIGSHGSGYASKYKKNFVNDLASPGYLKAQVIHSYSPLNKRMISAFSYEVLKQYEDCAGKQYILVEFSSKEGACNEKTKLYGGGTILYNITDRCLVEVEMRNYIDLYSRDIRSRFSDFKGLVGNNSIRLQYICDNGSLYLKRIMLNVEWDKNNEELNGKLYSLVTNARRNPFRYDLKHVECFEFFDMTSVPKHVGKQLENCIIADHMGFTQYYCAPYNSEKWGKVVFDGINYDCIARELSFKEPIVKQYEENALTFYESCTGAGLDSRLIDFSKNYYKRAEELVMLFKGKVKGN